MRSVLIPEYLNEFSCVGGDCEDTCCGVWNITVDKKTYQTYRRVRKPKMEGKLQKYVKRNRQQNGDSSFAKLTLYDNKVCHKMLEDGLGSIHK